MNNKRPEKIITSLDALMPMMKETLSQGNSITFSPKGISMLPMLRQGIDTVTISPIIGRLKKYDIPLYKRDNGQYVLHRIIDTGDTTYSCIGDNQFIKEQGVRHDQLIAQVTSFTRNGRKISVSAISYRLYCRIWVALFPVRKFIMRAKRYLRRMLK